MPKLYACPKDLIALEKIEAERRRSVERMRLLVKGQYDKIERDGRLMRPFAGGGAHKHPGSELGLHRDFFKNVYATSEEVDEFDRVTSGWYTAARAALLLARAGNAATIAATAASSSAASAERLNHLFSSSHAAAAVAAAAAAAASTLVEVAIT